MSRAHRIFVQVPEYRDSELEATLTDLFSRADRPDLLRVVVLSQRAPEDPRVLVPNGNAMALEVLEVPATASRGPNWARRVLQERYEGETYALLIDSHLRFATGWDTMAVAMLQALQDRSAKPLLTAYLPAYAPGVGRSTAPYKIYPLGRQDGVLTRLTSFPLRAWQQLDAPVVAEYLSLHFAFSSGSLLTEVQHDPEVYFFGDEVAYGARAFTHGWDLFHPHRVLGWHAYNRGTRKPHWDDHPEWGEQHQQTLLRLRRLFAGDPAMDELRGDARTVADYERHIMTPLVQP